MRKSSMNNIITYCNAKTCEKNIEYNKLKTGTNDPSLSKAMRYSQYLRTYRRNHQVNTSTNPIS